MALLAAAVCGLAAMMVLDEFGWRGALIFLLGLALFQFVAFIWIRHDR